MNQKKTIGIVGGISPMSTEVYYSRIAMEFNEIMGGLNFPRVVLSSVNMADIHEAEKNKNFREPLRIFISAISDMPSVDFVIIASNTMHRVVRSLKTFVDKDILDIREVVADSVLKHGYHKVLLLGSQYTMTGTFYRQYLVDKGLEVVIPNDVECKQLNNLIYDHLCRGDMSEDANRLVENIVSRVVKETGAQAVVLACTEFSLLRQDFCVPSFDSSELHVKAAVNMAING